MRRGQRTTLPKLNLAGQKLIERVVRVFDQELDRQQVSPTTLSRTIGWTNNGVYKTLDNGNMTLRTVGIIAEALDCEVVFKLRPRF